MLVTVILAVVGWVLAVFFGLKSVRKKKPVWAYQSTKIIGLGSDAPPELKLAFNGQPINEAYITRFIFYNRGTEAIRDDDVVERVAIYFKGATILRQPRILAKSKKAIRFSATKVAKAEGDAIGLDFLYLSHNDGAVVEVIHTLSDEISLIGTIVDVAKIGCIGEFVLPLGVLRSFRSLRFPKWSSDITPTPTTELETYTGADVEGRKFSIDYPEGWTSDDAERVAKQEYYKETRAAGYTVEGACLMFYRSPDKDAYLMVASVDSPLPVTVDRVLPSVRFSDMFSGYAEVARQILGDQKLRAMHWFTCSDGKAKQLVAVKVAPPQLWYVTCIAVQAAFDDYESTFDHILDSFSFLS